MTKKNINDKNLFNKVIAMISGIFIPIINVLMAAALLKGILLLLVNLSILKESEGAYQILFAISDGFFYFLPVFLAYSAAIKLKAEPFTAVLIAVALLYPGITERFASGEAITFFGLPIKAVTYSSGVIPILLAVWMLHYVEIPFHRILPKALKGFMVPLLSLIIVVPTTFLVFGPIGVLIGDALANAFTILYQYNPILAGAIFGLLWQPMVVFGFHWGLVPVALNNIANLGVDPILPILGPAVYGQAGAAMAVSFLAKSKSLKTVALSGSITAILGVTEPALFGVNIPLKRPMAAACIAGAIGGGIVGISGAGAVSFAFPSVLTFVVYLGRGFLTFAAACVAGFVIGFVLTYLFRFKEPLMEELKDE